MTNDCLLCYCVYVVVVGVPASAGRQVCKFAVAFASICNPDASANSRDSRKKDQWKATARSNLVLQKPVKKRQCMELLQRTATLVYVSILTHSLTHSQRPHTALTNSQHPRTVPTQLFRRRNGCNWFERGGPSLRSARGHDAGNIGCGMGEVSGAVVSRWPRLGGQNVAGVQCAGPRGGWVRVVASPGLIGNSVAARWLKISVLLDLLV